MKKLIWMLLAIGTLLSINSCKKETSETKDPDPIPNTPTTPEGMIKIGETYVIGANAKAYVYTKQAIFTGYNTIYVAMYDSADGSRLTAGNFNLEAKMEMGTEMHTCPIENNENIDSTNNLFHASLVFIMPSVAMEKWTLQIGYHNNKINKDGKGELDIMVVDANPIRLYAGVLAADDSTNVFVSFVLPTKGKVGLNDAEFTIQKKSTLTNFPAITDYTIQMIPTMPSMGHGSPNNVDPTHVGDGHYKGKLNFTMTGLWKIQLKLYKNGNLLTDQIFFNITI